MKVFEPVPTVFAVQLVLKSSFFRTTVLTKEFPWATWGNCRTVLAQSFSGQVLVARVVTPLPASATVHGEPTALWS
ncbi:MAG: hypothetical protein ACKOCF_04075, partial [Gammaproteobacteria bacterium]